jgi:tetratricopeptide (TPR) repeat protein
MKNMVGKIFFISLFVTLLSIWLTTSYGSKALNDFALAVKVGQVAQSTDNYPVAIHAYESALAKRPRELSIIEALGNVYQENQQFDKALKLYQSAYSQARSAIDKNELQRQLGVLYFRRGETNLALQQFLSCLALRTDGKEKVYNDLGILLDQQCLPNLADACYQRGLQYAPNDINLQKNLALSKGFESKSNQIQQANCFRFSQDQLNKIRQLCGYLHLR